MKVIFLDIDGVLNVIPQGHDVYGATFHPHLVENLKSIIDATGSKIVISSTWRFSGLATMQEMWFNRQLPGEVIDITNREWTSLARGYDISDWLARHIEVSDYVIIDDDDDMLDSQLPFFVKTSGNPHHIDCIDIGYGLTKECAIKAIEILNQVTQGNKQ